jgi:hypothetical protein
VTSDEDKTSSDQEPAEIRERIKPLVNELSERLAEIDPNLVVTLSSRKNSPPNLRGEGEVIEGELFNFTTTFNDFTNLPNQFVSAFAKAGNGFANISGIADEIAAPVVE